MISNCLRHASMALSLCLIVYAGSAWAQTAPGPCDGTFSNTAKISFPATYMPDVGYPAPKGKPALSGKAQTVCDVFTFAWNQFLYYTQTAAGAATPRFMTLAPWYNALKPNGSPKPGPYPGGPTDLRTAMLDQGQAGDDDHLLDVAGKTVRYDIRFDVNMYNSIVEQNLYTEALFSKACDPILSQSGTCKNNNKIWMTPAGANEHPEPGAIEVKTAWRDFVTPAACPAKEYYCNGRFALVGFHYVNKTFSHGEWIWASFEHVANDPDCQPGGDSPIAPKSPLGTNWSFFNPATAGPNVMNSKRCSVAAPTPQCNSNPGAGNFGTRKIYKPVNVCRTLTIAAGGASPENCKVSAPGSSDNSAGNIACLNASILPKLSGVWKNYKLVGAVWTKGGMGPNTDFRVSIFQVPPPPPSAVVVEPAGSVHLANTTMETWMQHGSTGYDPFKTNAKQAGCFLCHNMPSGFAGHNRQVDLSHFPGKLPEDKQKALRNSLLSANSTAAAPQ